METLSQILFWVGLVSIPLSWLVWFFGPQIEVGRHILSNITDPALWKARVQRWGFFVGLWPTTLLVLSLVNAKRV